MPLRGPKFCQAFPVWWLVMLTLLPLLAGACASTSKFLAQRQRGECGDLLTINTSNPATTAATQPDPLELCARVSEEELQTMRGCYNEFYYFAYKFDITAGADPKVDVSFSATVPEKELNNLNTQPNMVSFNNGSVQYQAGLGGDPTGGNGFFQMVNVAGSNTMVIASTEVKILIPNATSIIPSINIFSTPNLSGYGRW